MSTTQKFNINDFKILDNGDLFINVWSYSYQINNICKKNVYFAIIIDNIVQKF